MDDIIIYTTEESLSHKQDKLEGDSDKSNCGMYYWTFSRLPSRLKNFLELKGRPKVYFATKGIIRGYFEIADVLETGNPFAGVPANSITWLSKTWKDIKPIPTKSFQGFKYADKVPELFAKEVKDETIITEKEVYKNDK